MKHIDLFSGIGGFAIAADTVWPGIEHTFVEYDPFCQAVLRKHYPNSIIHGDIRSFIADTERGKNDTEHKRPCQSCKQQGTTMEVGGEAARQEDRETCNNDDGGCACSTADTEREGREGELWDSEGQHRLRGGSREDEKPFVLTGGFPCQPFSHAGRRKGTSDDRYLWPEMFRVIQLYRPTWVIAENVRGLVTWNYGMVLETVCTDLENEGYEVQPFIIPACAVGAPHRRDRVWIVAHANSGEQRAGLGSFQKANGEVSERNDNAEPGDTNEQWAQDWREVALATCHDGVDDGVPRRMVRLSDGTRISHAKWRKEALKAYGNAIVPAVAQRVMSAINCAQPPLLSDTDGS